MKERWNNRARHSKHISYHRKIRYNWNEIERINGQFGINRDSVHVDDNGYLRWNEGNQLCHRDIAFNLVYKKICQYCRKTIEREADNFCQSCGAPINKERFGEYDVHHKDGNKFNNLPLNLQLLKRKEHEMAHGKTLYENGQGYVRLVDASVPRAHTKSAVLIGGKRGTWYPKSQLIVRDGYIYASKWILAQKSKKPW